MYCRPRGPGLIFSTLPVTQRVSPIFLGASEMGMQAAAARRLNRRTTAMVSGDFITAVPAGAAIDSARSFARSLRSRPVALHLLRPISARLKSCPDTCVAVEIPGFLDFALNRIRSFALRSDDNVLRFF